MSHHHAAAIPVAGLTAWQALFDRGGLREGQTVVIAGAAGGVGHFAVQFARHAGARRSASARQGIVISCSTSALSEYVDYTEEDVASAVEGADLAFDTVGGETTASLLPTLREGGTVATIAGKSSSSSSSRALG